jgi:hypothetical protein
MARPRRLNGGRPFGSKNKKTLALKVEEDRMKAIILKRLEPLLQARLESAVGAHEFYAKTTQQGWIRVTDPKLQLEYLNLGAPFFRIENKAPDSRIGEDCLNRVFGRPKEVQELSGVEGKELTIVVKKAW